MDRKRKTIIIKSSFIITYSIFSVTIMYLTHCQTQYILQYLIVVQSDIVKFANFYQRLLELQPLSNMKIVHKRSKERNYKTCEMFQILKTLFLITYLLSQEYFFQVFTELHCCCRGFVAAFCTHSTPHISSPNPYWEQ